MAEGIFFGIVLLFLFLGTVGALYRVMLSVLHPKRAGQYIVILRLGRETEDPTGLIYAARVRAELSGERGKCRIIAVDMGMKEDDRRACETFCRCNAHTEFCSREALMDLLWK